MYICIPADANEYTKACAACVIDRCELGVWGAPPTPTDGAVVGKTACAAQINVAYGTKCGCACASISFLSHVYRWTS